MVDLKNQYLKIKDQIDQNNLIQLNHHNLLVVQRLKILRRHWNNI